MSYTVLGDNRDHISGGMATQIPHGKIKSRETAVTINKVDDSFLSDAIVRECWGGGLVLTLTIIIT